MASSSVASRLRRNSKAAQVNAVLTRASPRNPSTVSVATAVSISGVPSSYPGYALNIGSSGDKVRQLQTQLNRIARNYPAIPTVTPDGVYGPATAESVRIFQGIFHLPQTGVTDYATWYEISEIYVGVSRISEPG